MEAVKSFITRKPALFTKEMAAYAPMNLCYDSAKVKAVLNYSFIPIRQSANDAALHFKNEK
jgi:hypothetical protein